MDQLVSRISALVQKNKYVLIIILLGIFLMLLPSGKTDSETEDPVKVTQQPDMQTQLESILSQISGVGKVRVLLTVARGEETLYVRDEQSMDSADTTDLRSEAVIVTDDQHGEKGLVVQVIPPVYQGAVVVCQGGDLSSVQLAVVEAVCDATGLTADKITVLKMK